MYVFPLSRTIISRTHTWQAMPCFLGGMRCVCVCSNDGGGWKKNVCVCVGSIVVCWMRGENDIIGEEQTTTTTTTTTTTKETTRLGVV